MSDRSVGGYGRITPDSYDRPPTPSRPAWMAPPRPAEPSWMEAERESRTRPLQIAESSSARRPGPPPPPGQPQSNNHRNRRQQQSRGWYLTNQSPPRPLHPNGTITKEFTAYLRREFDSQMPQRRSSNGVRYSIEGIIIPESLIFHGINFEEGRRGSELFRKIYEESLGLEAGRPLTEQNTPGNFMVRSRP